MRTGFGKKIKKRKIHSLYHLSNIVRTFKCIRLRWKGYVTRNGDAENAFQMLRDNPTGNRLLGKPGCRCNDNTRINLK